MTVGSQNESTSTSSSEHIHSNVNFNLEVQYNQGVTCNLIFDAEDNNDIIDSEDFNENECDNSSIINTENSHFKNDIEF